MNKSQMYSMVKNAATPICKDCKYFRKTNLLYRILGCASSESRCALFGEKDKVTGKIISEYAWIARSLRECGTEGKYFEKK